MDNPMTVYKRSELVKYIRDRHGHPVGVLVSNNPNSVGWSLCARSHGDKFDKEKGLMIARAREHVGFNVDKLPYSIAKEFNKMLLRSQAYFKGAIH